MAKKIERNDPCWCGSGKKYKKCHEAFDEKMELMKKKGYAVLDHDLIKTPAQIEKIKESCKINIAVLDYVAEHIGPGVTTQQIDDWVHEETVRHGGIPAPLNYEGFPKSVCTSVNDQVCHGIPSEMLFYRKVILSMLMYLLFITVIFHILPECFVLVKFQKKRKS